MIRIVPPRRRLMYPLGADSPSSCDPQTQYFDSEFTQTCRSFSDVGPVKLSLTGKDPNLGVEAGRSPGPICQDYNKRVGRNPMAYPGQDEASCAKKISKMGAKPAAKASWVLPVAIGGGIIAVALWMRSRK